MIWIRPGRHLGDQLAILGVNPKLLQLCLEVFHGARPDCQGATIIEFRNKKFCTVPDSCPGNFQNQASRCIMQIDERPWLRAQYVSLAEPPGWSTIESAQSDVHAVRYSQSFFPLRR